MTEASGPALDTAAGDVVSILVTPDPPYGIILEPDMDGKAAVIKAFEKLPSGKFGVIQKHGGVHSGDVLFAINEIVLDSVPHGDTIVMINDRNILKKTFKFMNSREYYRKRRGGIVNSSAIAENSKSSFLSSIRRYRVSNDEYNRKFAEYEIACQLRVPGSRVQKDIVHKWSVWKRYSEFEKLNAALRISLGWQIDGVDFPSPYTFSLNKLSPEFIEQRRDELNQYWQKVIVIDRVSEFTKHHCSPELKAFLDVDEVVKGAKIAQADTQVETTEENESADEDAKRNSTRKAIQRTSSIRRRSLNANTNPARSVLAQGVDSNTVESAPSPRPITTTIAPKTESSTSEIPQTTATSPPPPPPPKAKAPVDPIRSNLFSQIASFKRDD